MTAISALGPFRLHERLADRGTETASSVHLGWLVRQARLVAVKRLHPQHVADEAGLARVRDQVRVAMGVKHLNVVATLGMVRRPGEVFAAMEYVPGASVAEIAAAAGPRLEPGVASAIAAGALRGLHAVHQARPSLMPRRVSPGRVLVGEDGRARVIDLDVPSPTPAGAIVEALPYASPEQLVHRHVDLRCDGYAVACVLWEMLTGRTLFHAATVEGTLRKILSEVVAPPSRFAPGISPQLDAIVLRGLARDPDTRFESARAMASELERASCAQQDVGRTLASLDLACIRRRRALADDAVRGRERSSELHIECTRSASKG
jgi:serine/threonine-protein kinase